MVNKKFVGGNADNENNTDKDLASLKQKIDVMYKYRNNEIQDEDLMKHTYADDTPNVINNKCYSHLYNSFDEYQKTIGTSYSLSIGDLDDALNAMSYCTCNARSIEGCYCVTRTGGDSCQCYLRSPYTCACVVRSGNKYVSSCNCNVQDVGCNCVSRVTNSSCECNTRCSCNVVNEYDINEPPTECTCVSREFDSGCKCNARTITYDTVLDNTQLPASCYIVNASSGCECVARRSSCPANVGCNYVGWHCDGHVQPQRINCCTCDVRTSVGYKSGACDCVARKSITSCAYNVVKIDKDGNYDVPGEN